MATMTVQSTKSGYSNKFTLTITYSWTQFASYCQFNLIEVKKQFDGIENELANASCKGYLDDQLMFVHSPGTISESDMYPGTRTHSSSYSARIDRTHSTQRKKLKLELDGVRLYVYPGDPGDTSRQWVNFPSKTDTVNLTADPLDSYKVTYNANGGSGAPSAQTKWYGETLALSSTAPTRTNYVFKSWNTAQDGSGTTYSPGANYTGNAAITLYAQWYAPYSVTYNANGGTSAPSSQVKVYNQSLALTTSKPSRTNYVFKNWNTQANGSGTTYNPGATYSTNANLTLYAQWYAPYSVTFNANGGTGAPSSQVKVYNQNLTLSSTKPTRASYVFRRWNTNTSDTGTAYNPGASYATNSNLALYAIWNPTITYDANGGTGAPAAQTKTFGAALTLQSGTPTRTGYTFLRWNTARDGSGTSYNAGATMTAGSNTAVTLYAQWQKNPNAPTISSLTVVRSDSSGTASNSGTWCKVTAKWSIDTTNVSGNTATVTGTIKPDNGSATSFSFTSGASGTGGTATALVANCDTDHQYTVTVTVTDTRTSTSRSAIMTTAFFILDLKAGGQAMGIGSAAPATGLEVGWAAQFDQAVGMLMGLSVGADLTVLGSIVTDQLKVFSVTSDVCAAASGWTLVSQAAYTYGSVVMVTATLRPTADVAANASGPICTLASGYRPRGTQGFCDSQGVGTISSGGSCTYRNLVALTTTSTVTVSATFVK